METWITSIMNEYGYVGVFLLIALENLFPPIPSEIILTFGGFMTTQSELSLGGVIVSSTLGSVVGAVLLYGVGRLLDMSRLERIVTRYGRLLRLSGEDLHRTFGWFERYGSWAVFLCRFVPLIRSLISIPAGTVRMKIVPFLLLTTLGSLIWNAVLIYLGAAVGASWESIVHYMDVYSNFIYGLLLVLLVLFVIVQVRKRKGIRPE
ncbi:DedA family protein [Paenibacillus silviterrae]|uniref:DedA family protein n=1 Tax=Paenibacillus silviterrae TaxID=3242194 RepID=UPI002543AC54|nr:DedA family protein [Paenibacillus chinjuensis]